MTRGRKGGRGVVLGYSFRNLSYPLSLYIVIYEALKLTNHNGGSGYVDFDGNATNLMGDK